MRGTSRKVAPRPGPRLSFRGSDAAHGAPNIVTVHVAVTFREHRGRKALVVPDGSGREVLMQGDPARARDGVTPAVRALARAFRWRRLLETGAVATVHEIAAAENINSSYVSRVIRLTLLSPEIVEAVAVGTEVSGAAALDTLMTPFPLGWCRQVLLDD